MAENRIALPLPDQAGQGALFEQVRELSRAMRAHVDRGEVHEAKYIEARLDRARAQWLKLHKGKVLYERTGE